MSLHVSWYSWLSIPVAHYEKIRSNKSLNRRKVEPIDANSSTGRKYQYDDSKKQNNRLSIYI